MLLATAAVVCPKLLAERFQLRDSVLTIACEATEIHPYEFKDRSDIREVRFEPDAKIESIGDYAFLGCENLKEIELPASLRRLGEGCFRETGMTRVEIPASVTAIPKAAFAWCEALENVKLPERLADISSHAFAYCRKLNNIDIPESVSHIGSNAFTRCLSLEKISLPAAMKELESYAFSDCVKLREAVLPANSNMLGELIFSGCESLRDLTVMSGTPPTFDCDSFIFEPDETALYARCRLHVPAASRSLYKIAPGWKLFFN